MTIKTDASRFHIHDELTAPDASAPLIKSIQTAGGAVSKFLGVLAESSLWRCAAIPDCAPSSTRASCRGRPVSASASPSPSGATTPLHPDSVRPDRTRKAASAWTRSPEPAISPLLG